MYTTRDIVRRIPQDHEIVSRRNSAEIARRHLHPLTDDAPLGTVVWVPQRPAGDPIAVAYPDGTGGFGRNGDPALHRGDIRFDGDRILLDCPEGSFDLTTGMSLDAKR
jgi:hypothetical protein